MTASGQFTMENEAFVSLVRYGTLILGKVVLLSMIIVFYRVTKKIFITPEDTGCAEKNKEKHKAMLVPDEDIERVRRAQRNDMENIFPFVMLSLLYLATGPDAAMAILHFKVFFWARVAHTVVYLLAIPQPTRAIVFTVGLLVNVSLVVHTILALP